MKPIKRLLIAFILAVVICQLSFIVFTHEIKKYEAHSTDRLDELLLNHTDYDLIFLGSSRVHAAVYPRIIDSICKLGSYNAGLDGANLYEFEMMLNAYLENHPAPRYVALSFDLHSFIGGSSIFNYPIYFPYISNKVIRRYLQDDGYLTTAKRIVPFLRMGDYDDDDKGAFLKLRAGKSEIMPGDFQYKGYLSNTDETVRGEGPIDKHVLEINSAKKEALARIIEVCRQKNIELLFLYLPEYKSEYEQSVTNSNDVFAVVDSFAAADHIPFIRDDRLKINDNPLLFRNVNHLNKEGAREYSIILAKELQAYLGGAGH